MPSVADLAQVAHAVYDERISSIGSWTRRAQFGNPSAGGFYAALFLDESERVAALGFRGTDDASDVVPDIQIFLGTVPNQVGLAQRAVDGAYNLIGRRRPLYLTGHSLGGGLAAIMAAANDLPAVTFNSPGMARSFVATQARRAHGMVPSPRLHGVRILHIRSAWDVVSVGTGPKIGESITIQVVGCEFEQPSLVERAVERTFPVYGMARNVGRAAGFGLCQHSMDVMLRTVRGMPRFQEELPWDVN